MAEIVIPRDHIQTLIGFEKTCLILELKWEIGKLRPDEVEFIIHGQDQEDVNELEQDVRNHGVGVAVKQWREKHGCN